MTVAAALVVVSVAAVVVWSQVRETEPTQVIDDEAGLRYDIPQSWVQAGEAEMAGEVYAMYSSVAEAPGNAWVRVRVSGPGADALTTAKGFVAAFNGADWDSPSMVEEESVIDGHAATRFSDSDDEGRTWMAMAIEFDDRWVEVSGMAGDNEPHLIEELESIYASITVL
ncbi:hypothetical protein [Glycomyces sp. NPDC021274]|uniref:hypothetical protein n=1 Tax=Glycomyces sp. NPDC021274 TaxID=3155120 RepID=UPI0033CF471B